MKNFFWSILLGTFSLVGCATQNPADTKVADAGSPKQVCTKEVALGSQIPRTVCRTPGSSADGVEALRNAIRSAPDTTYKP